MSAGQAHLGQSSGPAGATPPGADLHILRRLRRTDRTTGNTELLEERDLLALDVPLIILGDPGLGKSVLTQALGAASSNRYVRAGKFVRCEASSFLLPPPGGKIIIDGLDEVASNSIGSGLDAVLGRLSALGYPPFILSSREADWQGAVARTKIEDDYGLEISVLRLEPFSEADATAFLAAAFPEFDASTLLEHLQAHSLQEMYRNPLTLRLVGEVFRAEAQLPATRAALLERACTLLLTEINPRHGAGSHALRSPDELLLAGGALFASLLLCDRQAVHDGSASGLPDDCLPLNAVAKLPLAAATGDVLKTRLVQADGEGRWSPAHRIIAEYLGARWIAACVEQGASQARVRALVSPSGAPPTSLRGLSAWVAHFSVPLAAGCIQADPFAVLRYGNAETLSLADARLLLNALSRLSQEDPYFRSEDWSRHPAAGLMRAELEAQILSYIADPDTPHSFTDLLLEAMVETPTALRLSNELEGLLFDVEQVFSVRSRSTDALVGNGTLDPTGPALDRLLSFGDADSQRLAFELLSDRGLGSVPATLAVEVVLAHAGLSVCTLPHRGRELALHLDSRLFTRMSDAPLGEFLDALAAYAGFLAGEGDHWGQEAVMDGAREAVVAALERPSPNTAARVWRWLEWTRDRSGFNSDARTSLHARFVQDEELRREIQALVVLQAAPDDTRFAVWGLVEVSRGLAVNTGDVIALLERLGMQEEASDVERIVQVALLAYDGKRLPAEVRSAALALRPGDDELKRELTSRAKPRPDPYARKQKQRLAAAARRRSSVYAAIRNQHAENAEGIRAGEFNFLHQAAKVYLGRFHEFDKKTEPEARLEQFLGPVLAEDALIGFMAALLRSDLPTAKDIAELHAENRSYYVEIVLVCGIAERLRRGLPLSDLPRSSLDAAYMAWRRQTESNVVGGFDIGKALDPVLLAMPEDAETFFRASIEPQLAARGDHAQDLYQLTHDPRWTALAGHLAPEWLGRFRDLPLSVEIELLDAAVRHSPADVLKRMVTDSRVRAHASLESLVEWLAADFVVDFEATRTSLAQAAADDRNLLWSIRARCGGRHGARSADLTLAQRAFVVAAFGEAWPQTSFPSGSSTGDSNPWDASDLIRNMIYAIAGEPSAAAGRVLADLERASAPTYRDALRHAAALQRRLRRDKEYQPSTLEQVAGVACGALPETIDDMRAFFSDRIATLQARMHATNTDMWEAYWTGDAPSGENLCRNRLIEHISAQLPASVRFEPEMQMPAQTRADIAAIRGSIGLPVEIKGQWHSAVWDAPVDQLAARYAREWHAQGRGAYIVLWFGDVAGKTLPAHPDGLPAPPTPEVLETLLVQRIPEPLRDLIDVYVVDVSRSRPAATRRKRSAKNTRKQPEP